MKREEELEALRARARALEAHLLRLERRIRDIEQGFRPSSGKAIVAPERCLGCGLCEASVLL
jgi:ferredoxin